MKAHGNFFNPFSVRAFGESTVKPLIKGLLFLNVLSGAEAFGCRARSPVLPLLVASLRRQVASQDLTRNTVLLSGCSDCADMKDSKRIIGAEVIFSA